MHGLLAMISAISPIFTTIFAAIAHVLSYKGRKLSVESANFIILLMHSALPFQFL